MVIAWGFLVKKSSSFYARNEQRMSSSRKMRRKSSICDRKNHDRTLWLMMVVRTKPVMKIWMEKHNGSRASGEDPSPHGEAAEPREWLNQSLGDDFWLRRVL